MNARAAAPPARTGEMLLPRGSAAENPSVLPETPCQRPARSLSRDLLPSAGATQSREREGALTRISARRQQAGNGLQPRHQKVFGKEVKYHLQGLVGLQGVLQVALLHHRQVFVL